MTLAAIFYWSIIKQVIQNNSKASYKIVTVS